MQFNPQKEKERNRKWSLMFWLHTLLKYGATKEISENIGEVIRGAGMAVDVLPVKDVHDLTPYQAVIFGCAVYIGKWLKEAGDIYCIESDLVCPQTHKLGLLSLF